MNKKLSSQDKNLKKQNSPIDKKRRTIGQGLVLGIFESKKIKIEGLEISKRAFDKLVEFAQTDYPQLTIEQVVAKLIEEKFLGKSEK